MATPSHPSPADSDAGWLTLSSDDHDSHQSSSSSGVGCFGCSSCHPLGLRLCVGVHTVHPLFRTVMVPTHRFSGFPLLMQGGLQATMMVCTVEAMCDAMQDKAREATIRGFRLQFLKGVPALPPEDTESTCAHSSGAGSQGPGLPASTHPYRVAVVGTISEATADQLAIDLRLESAGSRQPQPTVYARGSIIVQFKRNNAEQVGCSLGAGLSRRPTAAVTRATKIVQQPPASRMPASNIPPSPSSLIESPLHPASDTWMPLRDAFLPHIPDYYCFGCGSANQYGFHPTFELNLRSGALRTLLPVNPHWSGRDSSLLHTGVALVPLDCVASWCVMLHQQALGLTATMDTTYIADAVLTPTGDKGGSTSVSGIERMILIEGCLVARTDRHGLVVANLYTCEVDRLTPGQVTVVPSSLRLCLSSRLLFTFASESIVRKLMGEKYTAGVRAAMGEYTAMLAEANEVHRRASGSGVTDVSIPPIPVVESKADLERFGLPPPQAPVGRTPAPEPSHLPASKL